jgi:hypothetical protein
MEELKKIISLKEASEISGYNQDYLSSLIRAGKLNGKKMGRSWVTTKEDLSAFMSRSTFSPIINLISPLFSRRTLFYTAFALAVAAALFFYNKSQAVPTVAAPVVQSPQGHVSDNENVEIDNGLLYHQ